MPSSGSRVKMVAVCILVLSLECGLKKAALSYLLKIRYSSPILVVECSQREFMASYALTKRARRILDLETMPALDETGR